MSPALESLRALPGALFGSEECRCGPRRPFLFRYLSVAALLAAIIVARRPDAVTNPQFWAEDGYVFFYENLTLGFSGALAKLYFGFPYLTHRLIAFAGGLVPLAFAPRVYTTSAIVLTALGLASFALPAFRHLVRSDALRVLFGVLVVSAPFSHEVLSNPTNLGWFLAIVLSVLSLARLPRSPRRVALLCVAGAVLVCSTPLALVNLPLWLLRAWHGARRSHWGEVAFSAVLVGMSGVVLALTRGLGAEALTEQHLDLFDIPVAYLTRCLGMMSYRAAALVLPPESLAAVEAAGPIAVDVVTMLLLSVLLGLCAAGRFRTLPGLLVAVCLFSAYFVVFLVGRPKYFLLLSSWGKLNYRYTIFPVGMFALALVTALDSLRPGRLRRCVGACMAAMLLWAWSSRFALEPFRDLDWPTWSARLEQTIESGSSQALKVPMNPLIAPLVVNPLDFPKATPPSD